MKELQGEIDDPNFDHMDAGKREEYHVWKGNAPLLYEYVMAQSLQWPSLTVKWLPDPIENDEGVTHRLLLGTHTGEGEQNHLHVAEVCFKSRDVPGCEAMSFEIVQSINHPGDVNRAAYNPFNPVFVATKTVKGDVLVYDLSKHPDEAPSTGDSPPEVQLTGHMKEGYAIG